MNKFVSRKFLIAFLVIFLEFLRPWYSLPQESESVVVAVALAYLGGQSFIDAVLAYKGAKKI